MVPSGDREGRAMNVAANFPPLMYREMEEMIYSHRFPFKTRGDLLRWCVFWGMRRLEEYKPNAKGVGLMVWVDIEKRKHTDALYLSKLAEEGEALDQLVNDYQGDGEMGKLQAYAVVKREYDRAMEIQQPYYRKKKRDEIRKKYGHLLADPPKTVRVSLDPETFEGEEEGEGEDMGVDDADTD